MRLCDIYIVIPLRLRYDIVCACCCTMVLWYRILFGWGTTLAHAYTIHIEIRNMEMGSGRRDPY